MGGCTKYEKKNGRGKEWTSENAFSIDKDDGTKS